jgi:hypothetical protein
VYFLPLESVRVTVTEVPFGIEGRIIASDLFVEIVEL